MNCQEFSRVVDGDSPRPFSAEQEAAIAQHLAECDACRMEWNNWREIEELDVPPMPTELRGRVRNALRFSQQAPRRTFRPIVVGGLLLAGLAAAAAIMVWNASGPEPQVTVSSGVDSFLRDGAASASESAADAAPETGVPASDVPVDSSEEAQEQAAASALRFLIVLRPETGADPEAVANTSQCHDAVVRHLRAVPEFEIIAPGTVTYAARDHFGLTDGDREAARTHGASRVLVISTEMGCGATLFDPATGNLDSGAGGQLLAMEGYDPSATRLAQRMRQKYLSSPEDLWEEARSKVLDNSLPEQKRVEALWGFQEYRMLSRSLARRPLDSEVIAAAARIATSSADPSVRESIWAALRGVRDRQIIQPLMKALASDSEAGIRMQAAFSLRTFLDEPGVREALLRAAAEDPDTVPSHTCCTYTVREAAERAAVPDSKFREWVQAKLHDESLPVRSRLRPLSPSTMDGRIVFLHEADFGTEAVRIVFDLGRRSQDPEIRLMAWDILGHAKPDASFIPQFLEDLKGHPNEYVRANAAKLLFPHAADPDVARALEAARSDPSGQVRIAASGVQRPFLP